MPITGDPIDLNTLHKRAGGTNETQCTLNDTDIKALKVGAVTGNNLGDYDHGLKESYTVGNVSGGASGTGNYGYADGVTDLDDITNLFNPDVIYSGWEINVIAWLNTVPGQFLLTYKDSGATGPASASNSGWEALKVGSTYFYRADATYSTSSDTMTWSWGPNEGFNGVNPYPTNGSDTIVKLG